MVLSTPATQECNECVVCRIVNIASRHSIKYPRWNASPASPRDVGESVFQTFSRKHNNNKLYFNNNKESSSTSTCLRKHNTTTTVWTVAKDWSIRAVSDEQQDRVCLMFVNCARQCLRFVLAGNLPAKTKRKHFRTISRSHDLLDRL